MLESAGVVAHPEANAIGVDIPIGLCATGRRLADGAARELLGARRSTVFPAPTRAVLRATSYEEAGALTRASTGKGITRQTWALVPKIAEVGAALDERVIEVHPEVSFAVMANWPLTSRKQSWNGFNERRGLLAAHSLIVPDQLAGSGDRGASDDILDAVVAAWSASRWAAGEAISLPSPPEVIDGRAAAIWYYL